MTSARWVTARRYERGQHPSFYDDPRLRQAYPPTPRGRRTMTKIHLPTLFLVLLLGHPLAAAAQASASAWDDLVRERGELARRASPLEREILKRLTPDQVESYLEGTSPLLILLESGENLADFLDQWSRGIAFDLSWYSVDGGGDMTSTGGIFELSGTIGQADAGLMTESPYVLAGGFWAVSRAGGTFSDGFASGDTSVWSASVGG